MTLRQQNADFLLRDLLRDLQNATAAQRLQFSRLVMSMSDISADEASPLHGANEVERNAAISMQLKRLKVTTLIQKLHHRDCGATVQVSWRKFQIQRSGTPCTSWVTIF